MDRFRDLVLFLLVVAVVGLTIFLVGPLRSNFGFGGPVVLRMQM